MSTKLEILKESRKRIAQIKFGDPVTNICAGESNPFKHSYFVRHENNSDCAEITDKNGAFANTGIRVIYPGHLLPDECKKLFEPVWESEYGGKAVS